MRAGNARTSVKPGATGGNRVRRLRRAVQAAPAAHTGTRSPVALLARNELGDLAAGASLRPPKAKRARRRRSPARCGATTLGAPQRRRAGWSCFVDRAESAGRRHDPVWTVLLGRAAAAARRHRVLVHQVQLKRARFRWDRASLPSKRSPAGVAVEVCPMRRCLFVVGLITIFKEGICSSRCWSMRSQVPMRR